MFYIILFCMYSGYSYSYNDRDNDNRIQCHRKQQEEILGKWKQTATIDSSIDLSENEIIIEFLSGNRVFCHIHSLNKQNTYRVIKGEYSINKNNVVKIHYEHSECILTGRIQNTILILENSNTYQKIRN